MRSSAVLWEVVLSESVLWEYMVLLAYSASLHAFQYGAGSICQNSW